MRLTRKQRAFVDAVLAGKSGKEAALAAGYSETGASVTASRLMRHERVAAAIERRKVVEQAKEEAKAAGRKVDLPDLSQRFSDPKDFLYEVMSDPSEEMRYRMEAAKVLMPYEHERKGAAAPSRKQEREKALKGALERFAVPAAPTMRQ